VLRTSEGEFTYSFFKEELMLKRLLTAVFVLGLILALNGTAFSGPSTSDVTKKVIPNNGATTSEFTIKGYVVPSNRPAFDGSAQLLTQHPNPPMGAGVDTTECYLTGWADWVNATYFITFPRRANHNNAGLAMRYDGPTLPNYEVQLTGAYNWIRRVAEGGVVDGSANVVVEVFDDLGGLPNTLLYSETFTIPAFPDQGDYLYFPFTTPQILSGAYHISFKADPAGPTTDTIVFTSDDAAYPSVGTAIPTNRSSAYSVADGAWFTAAAYFGGFNPNFDQIAEYCQYYTSCYWEASPLTNVTLYTAPGPAIAGAGGAQRMGFGQRFTAAGPETLKTVTFYHYDVSLSSPGVLYTPASTNYPIINVWGDDGTGNPDVGAGPLATVSLTPGIGLFPQTNLATDGWNYIDVDFSSFNLVLMGTYHITAEMASATAADGRLYLAVSQEPLTDHSGADVKYTLPGNDWANTGVHPVWAGVSLLPEVGFLIEPYLCKDEFALCQNQLSYTVGTSTGYGLPLNMAAQFAGEAVNRIEKIRFEVLNPEIFGEATTNPTIDVVIWASTPSGPGPEIARYPIPTITFYPGQTELVIPGGLQVLGDFFVGYEDVSPLATDYFYWAVEEDQGPLVRGGAWYYSTGSMIWRNLSAATGSVDNAVIEVEFCSIPPTTWTCGAADDYPTNAHDYGRTGHSNVSLSDAYCDLNLLWTYTDPGFGNTAAGGGAIGSNAPIIWDTFVVCVQNSKINIFNLNTGAVLATFSGNVAPYYVAVSLVRSTPTIATINVAGIPTPVLFYGGGNSMMAVKMEVGFPVLWDIRSANLHGFSGTEVGSGYTNNSAPIVANLGGIDYVFWGAGTSRILAANAETGTKAWATTLVSNPVRNLAFDGANLYTATIAAPPTITDGDVYSIDATDGTINWQLSTAGGLVGNSVLGSTNETFADQLAVHNGELFTVSAYLNSTLSLDPGPEFDDEGVLYNLNTLTGAINWTAKTQHFYQGGGLTIGANVMIDAAKIIVAGGSTWTSTPMGGTVIAHNRFTGGISWVGDAGVAKTTGGNLSNGFMTCESGLASQIYLFNVDGYLSCFDGDDGNEVFHRRIDYLSLGFNSQGAGGAIADDGTVVFGTFSGQLIALKKGADRGRLEIMDYTPTTPVSFGSNPAFPVTLPAIYTNTGCATITGTYTISTTSNGSLPGVSQWSGFDVVDRTASIADQLTASSRKAFKGSGLVTVSQETQVDASRSTLNQAALAVPAYLNDVAVNPLTVNPGDTFDITLSVNQPLMPRGPNRFYISFDTDDPDFFLNNVTEDPEILVTLVGGCLIDTTHLHFGAGSANLQAVTNSGRLGTGDWNPTPGNFDIQGDAVSFYQGTYVYGVNRNRIALNSQDWWSGGGEDDSWISMQADQNRCNTDCKPALTIGVSLGSITLDGGNTYSPLTGNMVCKDYIDSVLVYDPDGAGAADWNWLNFETAFFDPDSTMGLSVSTSTFGAVDVPAPYEMLNDVTIEVMKVKTRNGQVLNNWKFGVGIDYDIIPTGDPDTTGIDRTISTVFTWNANAATSDVWGMVKLPFGGGCAGSSYEPVKNAKALARSQSMTSPSNSTAGRHNAFADSSYFWMNQPIGGTSQGSMTSSDDQDAFATFAEKSFAAGGDSIQFAVAHFAMVGVTTPQNGANYADLANLLNKWVGFGRGDINNDGAINLADIIALADNVAGSGPGAIPFEHLGDVDGDGSVLMADVTYLVDYYFHYGPCPVGKFIIQ
jgi:hypothetical protein